MWYYWYLFSYSVYMPVEPYEVCKRPSEIREKGKSMNSLKEIWLSPGGSKFHASPKCRGLRNASEITKREYCHICVLNRGIV